MEQFKKLKSEIVCEERLLADAEGTVKRLDTKREEIMAKLSEIDGALSVAEENQNMAVTRYARGEISEDKLDKFQPTIFSLNAKKNAITRALNLVNTDLTAAEETKKDIRETLGQLKRSAWALVAKTELLKAADPLRRAFIAFEKSEQFGSCSRDSMEKSILKELVCGAVLPLGHENYELAADLLARDYLQ